MKKIIYVFGVSGVGKTTVLTNALKDLKVKYVSYGTKMFEILKRDYGIESRDDIRKLDMETYYKVFEEAAKLIQEEINFSEEDLIIIDTHILIDTKFGTFVGTPKWLIKKFQPVGVLVISAKVDEIIERAKKDETRKRDDLLNKEELERRLRLTSNTAFIIAYETHALFKEVINRQGELEKAVEEVKKFILNFL